MFIYITIIIIIININSNNALYLNDPKLGNTWEQWKHLSLSGGPIVFSHGNFEGHGWTLQVCYITLHG